MSHNCKNFFTDGGDKLVIGGELMFGSEGSISGGLLPNQAQATGTSGTNAITAINALLLKLKNSGLMVGDSFTLTVTKNVTDSVAGHANRQDNTSHISSVAESDGVITITLDKKVSELKDFDGGNGWGKHKWLGIGISAAGFNPITSLYYNGAALSAEDVSEATTCGLSAGYFVRWVAADLVLAGDNAHKSKDSFILWADGYAKTKYTLKIVEPTSDT